MFNGFCFDEDNPYTYQEGKRLIRLMGQEFRKNKRLVKTLGLDPNGKGRPALTRFEGGAVWDFIPLKIAKGNFFTSFPHATTVVRPDEATVEMIIPNSIRGGLKRRLNEWGKEDFYMMLAKVERNLRPTVKAVPGTKPMLHVVQRRYKSQRSQPETDGCVNVDLRTLVDAPHSDLKHQPGWLDAVHGLLSAKRTNIQAGIEVHLPFQAKAMQDRKALEIMAKAWIALKPLLDFGLREKAV